jgi:hypothetical protein
MELGFIDLIAFRAFNSRYAKLRAEERCKRIVSSSDVAALYTAGTGGGSQVLLEARRWVVG